VIQQQDSRSHARGFDHVSSGMDGSSDGTLIDEWATTDIDEWTRRVVRRHFDPVGGSPFWLARAAELPFDPLAITRYAELEKFGPFPREWLRHNDPTEMVPRRTPRPLAGHVWDTGGTTGSPCRVFYSDAMLEHRAVWRRWSAVAEGFGYGRTWLLATPTGPHLIGNLAWEFAAHFQARMFTIDMDPRWVRRMIRAGRLAEAGDYTQHLVEQISDVLEHQRVDYLITTSALLLAVARRRPELVSGLAGVRMSGTQITAEMYAEIREVLGGGICAVSYGNTFGNCERLTTTGPDGPLTYVPSYPQVTTTVVDREDWTRPMPFGSVGRVRLTVLHDDLFAPNILERDQAIRYDTGGRFPWEGVADVGPLEVSQARPEGLY